MIRSDGNVVGAGVPALILAAVAVLSAPQAVAEPLHLRINCGSGTPAVQGWEDEDPYRTDGVDYLFEGEVDLTGVIDPAPEELYLTVIHRDHIYDFPVPDGRYFVRLHFYDTDGLYPERHMDYFIEDVQVLDEFNISQAAGAEYRAVVMEFTVDVDDGDGLQIRSERDTGDDSFESGIEILALCAEGLTRCGDPCVDLDASPMHCGACFETCDPGDVCEAGSCRPDCGPGTVRQGDRCVADAVGGCGCGGDSGARLAGLLLLGLLALGFRSRRLAGLCMALGLIASAAAQAGVSEECVTLLVETGPVTPENNAAVLDRLSACCEPAFPEALDAYLDGTAVRTGGITRARKMLRRARKQFVNVRLPQAERSARQVTGLYALHHAELSAFGAFGEMGAAHLFHGMVLLKLERPGEAADVFRSALVIEPRFEPDPKTTPPDARKLFGRVRQELVDGPRGSLNIKSKPAGARVTLDGSPRGTTPVSLQDLMPGEHFLLVRLRGYENWEGGVRVEASRLSTQEIFLEPAPRRKLPTATAAELTEILSEAGRRAGVERILLVRTGETLQAAEVREFLVGRRQLGLAEPLATFCPGPPSPSMPAPVAPPEPPPPAPPLANGDEGSVFGSWWFWTLVGAAVVAASVSIPLLVDRDDTLQVRILRGP